MNAFINCFPAVLTKFARRFESYAYHWFNKGFDKVRFVAPVRVGSRIRCHASILDITEKRPGQFDFKVGVTVEIEGGDKPALVAEWLSVQMAN